MLIVENYYEWYDAIKYFTNNASDRSVLVLSSRTSAYDVTIDELYEYLSIDQVPQINLNHLSNQDLDWIINLFDRYGLWAEKATYSRNQKTELLKRLPEFSSILLILLKSPQIIGKFQEIISQLNNQREYYQVIISILVLSVLNYPTSIDRLIDFWGDIILDSKFKKNPVVSQLIEFDSEEIKIRSSTLARYILKLVVDSKIIVDTLVQMRRKAEEMSKVSDYFKTLSKNLVRFNNIQNLLPDTNTKKAILYYYESIKNLPSSKENPLFWLQYGIACLVLKEYDQTEKYLKTAYAYADQTPYFNKYQIDNHYARFLLEKAIDNSDNPNYMIAFRQASKIIDGQTRREQLHYPYKVAQLYAEFYETHETKLTAQEKREIAEVASTVMERINGLPEEKREQEYINKCQGSMQFIMEKVAGF